MYEVCKEIEGPEDVFSASLGTLFGYTPVTLSSAGETLVYTHQKGISHLAFTADHNKQVLENDLGADTESFKITIQTPDTHARNWSLHASSVWMAALFLADHVDNLGLNKLLERGEREICYTRKGRLRLLELGSGAGLPGLTVAKLLDKSSSQRMSWSVTLSDFPDDTLITTLRENVRRNDLSSELCRVVPYAWGEDVCPLLSGNEGDPPGYDIIIAADTLWNPQSHATFLSTLLQVLRETEEARAHLVAGFHTGRYIIASFLDAVSSQREQRRGEGLPGLEIENVQERPIAANDYPRPWSPDRTESEEEKRKWVVWIVLKWS